MKLFPENVKFLLSEIILRPLIIYGMGYVGGMIAGWCDDNHINYYFSDSNVDKLKSEKHKKIVTLEQMTKNYRNANIVIASINYFDEINANLMQLGFQQNQIYSYLIFWPKKISWKDLEQNVDWSAVKERAKIFASWIDTTAKYVADYSADKNFLELFLPNNVKYYSPDYIRFCDDILFADFSIFDFSFLADVSSCLAVLMSFKNPEEVIRHICETTKKSIIISYVTLEKLPNIKFRRSINYHNDYTELQFIKAFTEKGFTLEKKMMDPYDAVHSVYFFEKK